MGPGPVQPAKSGLSDHRVSRQLLASAVRVRRRVNRRAARLRAEPVDCGPEALPSIHRGRGTGERSWGCAALEIDSVRNPSWGTIWRRQLERCSPRSCRAWRPDEPVAERSRALMGETRVDLRHLLEDLRDAYPGSLEETILSEIIANSLDSGAHSIRFLIDPVSATLTIA